MKHNMFEKYPLLEKAFALSCPPAAIKSACERGMEIIEDCIDLPPDEKEALMIVALLSAAPDAVSASITPRLAAHGGLVQKISEEFHQAENGHPVTPNVARIIVAMQISLYESQLSACRGGNPLPAPLARQIKSDATQNRAALQSMNIDLAAPRLEALYQKTVDALLDAADQALNSQKKSSPRPPRNNGPSL